MNRDGYIMAELELSSVMIVVGRKTHTEIEESIAQYFEETCNTNLFVFLEQVCCVHNKNGNIDYGLCGYFEVTSAEDFMEIVKSHKEEFKDPNVPDHIVEFGVGVGKLSSMANWVESQYKQMMDLEYEQYYKKQYEDLEFEQWREENFDIDGEYIGPEFV